MLNDINTNEYFFFFLTVNSCVKGDIVNKYKIGAKHLSKCEFNCEIEVSKNSRDLYKPYGELLISILNLCKDCHFYEDFYKSNFFKNGWHWFLNCFRELLEFELKVINTGENMPDHWQKILRILKNKNCKDNPFLEYGSPALSLLIEQSIYLTKNPRFYTLKWRPFIRAIESINKLLKSKKLSKVVFEEGCVKASPHGGRNRTYTLNPITSEEIDKYYQ